MEDKYPECEKLAAVKEKSQAIGEFMDSLSTQGLYLCQAFTPEEMGVDCGELEEVYMPSNMPIEKVLAGYFGIDMNKVEAERRAMLDALRAKG